MQMTPQDWQRLRDRMTPIDLRDAEYAILADFESKSGEHLYPEDRCCVTVLTCCAIAGLHPIVVEPGVETTQLASLFKSFWLRNGRSPTNGEARAIVSMVNSKLLPPSSLIECQPGA